MDNRDEELKTINNADEIEPRKPAEKILEHEIRGGLNETRRSAGSLFIAGLSAGLDLGFSVFLMATFVSLDHSTSKLVTEILVAIAYSIGFVIVVIGRSELFTEHTTLAILPFLNGRSSLFELLRLWVIVFVSNILGGGIFALLASIIGPGLGVIDPRAFGDIASRVVQHSGLIILLSGVLAGWLMGLLSWLVAASRETVSQILIIMLITTTIGLTHLHHAIAGSIEVLVGIFSGQGITWGDFGHFLLWTTLGNILGGVFFVGVIKYAHVILGSNSPVEG